MTQYTSVSYEIISPTGSTKKINKEVYHKILHIDQN
jgi:hypothetical protein